MNFLKTTSTLTATKLIGLSAVLFTLGFMLVPVFFTQAWHSEDSSCSGGCVEVSNGTRGSVNISVTRTSDSRTTVTTTNIGYDSNGNIRSRTTTYSYDDGGNPTNPTNPTNPINPAAFNVCLPNLVINNLVFEDTNTGDIYARTAVPPGVTLTPRVIVRNRNDCSTRSSGSYDYGVVDNEGNINSTRTNNYRTWHNNLPAVNRGRYPVRFRMPDFGPAQVRNNQGRTNATSTTEVDFSPMTFPIVGTYDANTFVDATSCGGSWVTLTTNNSINFGNTTETRGCVAEDASFFTVVDNGGAPQNVSNTVVRVGRNREKDNSRRFDVVVTNGAAPITAMPTTPTVECNDGINNDSDAFIDFPDDPGCSGPLDPTEIDTPAGPVTVCDDGIDNDDDGFTDSLDPGCWTDPVDPLTYYASGTDETNVSNNISITIDKVYYRAGDVVLVSWDPGDFTGSSACTLSGNITNDPGFSGNADQAESHLDQPVGETIYRIVCDNGFFSDAASVTVYMLPIIEES